MMNKNNPDDNKKNHKPYEPNPVKKDTGDIVDPINDPDEKITPVDEPHHPEVDPIDDPDGDINPVEDPKKDDGFKKDKLDKRGDVP